MKYKDEVEKLAVQGGITSIYANNFRDFSNLNKVYMGKEVTEISSYAFTGTDKIKQFIISCQYLDLSFDPDFYSNLTKNATIVCNYSNEPGSTYDTAINSCKSVITNQMAGGSVNSVERIYQFDPSITKVWGNVACVVSSFSMLIERTAAYNGYESLSGNYNQSTGVDLVLSLTNNRDVITPDLLMKWPNTITRKDFVKLESDGEYHPLTLSLSSLKNEKNDYSVATEDELILLLKSHPEGILVFQDHPGGSHAVLVTNYNASTKTYSVLDPNGNPPKKPNERYFSNISGFYDSTANRFYYVTAVRSE